MVDEKILKRVLVIIIILALVALAIIMVRPILSALVLGLLGAYFFMPVQKKLTSLIKSPTISALLICLCIVLLIFIPFWFFTPMVASETFNIYHFIQKTDITGPLQKLLPSLFGSPEFGNDISLTINNLISKMFGAVFDKLAELLVSLPTILLQVAVIFVALFFALRDGEKLGLYLSEISPFSVESYKKFTQRFKQITYSFLYIHIIVGIVQGLATGLGLLIFGVPNALVLTLFATFVGILPILGPWLVWVPVAFYMILTGNLVGGIGLIIYGTVVVSFVDVIMRPLFMSYKSEMNSGLVLIGMIGGLLVFGFLGLIIGPLIVAYLLILLDFYKNKEFSKIFFE